MLPGYSGTTVNLATRVNATPATQVPQVNLGIKSCAGYPGTTVKLGIKCYPGYSGITVNLATRVNATPATQVLQ